jgi:hypothetical protein
MVNDCISRLRLPFGWMHTKRVGGISQTAIGAWKFYDGMTFDRYGMLLTGPMSWNALWADRAARKEYLSSPQWTEFAAVFPLLFDQAEAAWSALYDLKGRHLRSRLTDPDQWARTAAAAKRKHITAKEALAALRRAAVEDLTEMYEKESTK